MYLVTGNEDNPDARKAGQAARNVPDDPERGERIRSRMAELGLREIDVAGACEVTISAVQKWKKGTSIRTKNVAALAKVLDWKPQDLLGDLFPHYEKRTEGGMRPFEEVARRIQEVRGPDPDVSLTSLREELRGEIRQLREELTGLQREVADLVLHLPALAQAHSGTGERRARKTRAKKSPPASG